MSGFLTKELVLGLVRHVATGLGTLFAAKGYTEGSETEAFVGAVVFLVGYGWSAIRKIGRPDPA